MKQMKCLLSIFLGFVIAVFSSCCSKTQKCVLKENSKENKKGSNSSDQEKGIVEEENMPIRSPMLE